MARRPATRPRPSTASGRPSACSRTAARRSSCRAIRSSWRRCATSSASTSPRPSARWCCASTRRARSRRSTAPSRSCPCAPASRSGAATTTSAMARRPLFAALDIATGKVIGRCFAASSRARVPEVPARASKPTFPDDLDLHLVMDNYATHKTQAIRNWLARHPRWHVHFTPTSASWLNQVERFFADLTDKQLRRGVHRSTRRARSRHPRLHRHRQRRPKTVPVDQVRRRYPRQQSSVSACVPSKSPTIRSRSSNFGIRTLGEVIRRPAPTGLRPERPRPFAIARLEMRPPGGGLLNRGSARSPIRQYMMGRGATTGVLGAAAPDAILPARCRKPSMSRLGGAPKRRLYSRLNCEGLS